MAAKFSFHCQCYKKQSLLGIDRHNKRKNTHYSNPDIDTKRSKFNRIYVSPDETLYQACKAQIEQRVLSRGGRITKASNWICESIFSYPDELPKDRIDEYYGLILEYMADKLGKDNIVQAVCHFDESKSGLVHMHLDSLNITPDGRLSSRDMINREFITNVHNELPKILREHGFDVERGSDEHEIAGLDAKEYKKRMDLEATQLDKKINELSAEYNKLVDAYNDLINKKKRLEKRNLQTAHDIINHKQISR